MTDENVRVGIHIDGRQVAEAPTVGRVAFGPRHTPGPWVRGKDGKVAVARAEGETARAVPVEVATVNPTGDKVLDEANAALIAQAPVMLQVLRAILACERKPVDGRAMLLVPAAALHDLAARIQTLVSTIDGFEQSLAIADAVDGKAK
jgi:hypothetical protein